MNQKIKKDKNRNRRKKRDNPKATKGAQIYIPQIWKRFSVYHDKNEIKKAKPSTDKVFFS